MTIRRYHWQTERPRDQQYFLNSIVKVYRTYTKTEVPELINFTMTNPPPSAGPGMSLFARGYRSSEFHLVLVTLTDD